ncbi:MAG: hypothetical protein ACYTJ0_14395 [Planctomycetota bacterium]|jgi:hypothetical protein
MIADAGMNNTRLAGLLRRRYPHVEGADGLWRVALEGSEPELELYVLTDVEEDRIRIMIPVAQADRTDNDLLWVLLLANYDLALDAKYAVQDGVVWCLFLHRLSWLTEAELQNALDHVVTLARNTGSTFSSIDLVEQP